MKNFLLYCTLLLALSLSSTMCQEMGELPFADDIFNDDAFNEEMSLEEAPFGEEEMPNEEVDLPNEEEELPNEEETPAEEEQETPTEEEEGALRVADVEDFKVTIYEDSQDNNLYVKAINIVSNSSFGPTQVYQNLNREVVEAYITRDITLKSATDTQIELLLPLYDSPVELNLVYSDLMKKVGLLNLKTDELAQENDALKLQVDALKGKQMYGKTSPADWMNDDGDLGVFVDFSHLNLKETPLVVTSLNGDMYHYDAIGATSIYHLNSTSFSVYLRWSEGGNITTDVAVTNNWYLSYILISMDDMEA